MFIGHVAAALAAKRAAPRAPLGVLFTAALLPDYLWPVLVLAGAEQVDIAPGDTAFTPLRFVSYPWSHSLVMVAAAGAALGLAFAWRTRDRAGGVVLALLAVSHWVMDWLSHRADLPLVPGGAVYGLGLWNSIPATLLVEGGLFAAGVWLYAAFTTAKDRTGRYAYWSLVGVLGAMYAVDRFSPPPPGPQAVAWAGMLLGIVLYFWAAWIERHRTVR